MIEEMAKEARVTLARRRADASYKARLRKLVETARSSIESDGYAIVPGIIDGTQVSMLKSMFMEWYNSVPNLKLQHRKMDPHGIFKRHGVGQRDFMWWSRVFASDFFREFYGTDEVTTSMDGACFIEEDFAGADNNWTHTDQVVTDNTFKCVQGFLSFTSNTKDGRTFRVIPKSHLLHEEYGKTVVDPKLRKKQFHLIDPAYLESIRSRGYLPKALDVEAGSLVLWDSRVFHQNQYGRPRSGKRLGAYVCMLPRKHKRNTDAERRKRRRYHETDRTTSHWPYRIKVNTAQGNHRGDQSLVIDYTRLPSTTNLPPQDLIDRLIQ